MVRDAVRAADLRVADDVVVQAAVAVLDVRGLVVLRADATNSTSKATPLSLASRRTRWRRIGSSTSTVSGPTVNG